MAVTRKDLGIATAYGYAKSKGYTGTEEEFALLMKSYADVAEEAREAADDAEDARDAITAMGVSCETLEPGSPATVQKIVDGLGTVTLKFGIPEGADGDVTGDVIADEYSASKTYAVGDHVMKSGHYYVCKTAITTAEAWTAAHWTEVAVGDEVTDLKSQITPLADISLYNADLLTKGIVNSDGSITTANVYYVTPYIGVSGITDIYYSGYSTDYAQGRIYFYTSDKTPIKGYLPGIGGAILHIPEMAQYVVFSVHSNDITNVKIQQFGIVSDMDVDLQDTQETANFIQTNAIQIIYSKNLFNKDSVVNGKYYNEDGLYRTNSNLCHSNPIEVEENAQYSCSPAQFTISFFDKNGGFIGSTTANQTTFTTPIGCVRCVYNLLISQINIAMFNKGNSVETYEPYTKNTKLLGATYDIIVAQDGSGQYTSVTDAVNNCASGSTIFIKNGVYENEEIDASNKTVYIYGQSREFTIIKNNTNNYASPPLEIAAGSVENLTLYEEENTSTGQILAYACHIDYDYSFGRALHFKNVIFKNDLYQAVGIGLRGNFNLIFDNCEFYSRDRVAFYMHDSVASSTKLNQNVILHDCIIHSNGSDQTIRLVSYNQENANIDLTFINCALANHGYPQVLFYFQDTQGEGGTQTRVYTVEDLGNFHLNRLSYGNQLSVLNYPTT